MSDALINTANAVRWVVPGEGVVLYTGGAESHITDHEGRPLHVYYWGQKQTLFLPANARAMVFEMSEWRGVG